MRTAIGLTCGVALLCAAGVRAQELECPPLPPMSSLSGETSVGAEIAVTRILSTFGISVGRETTVDDVLSGYPNADRLYMALHEIAIRCPPIMSDPDLSMAQKREELGKLYEVVMRGSMPAPSPGPVEPDGGARDLAVPSAPPSDISGRYSGTLTERGRFIEIVLDIESGSGGTLDGELLVATRGGFLYEIEGQVSGNQVTFEAPVPGTQAYLSFEGEFTPDSPDESNVW